MSLDFIKRLDVETGWVLDTSTASRLLSEVPTGTIDGSNASFTLSEVPLFVFVFLNGLKLREGVSDDYTITGSTITFNDDIIPEVGDDIEVVYWYQLS